MDSPPKSRSRYAAWDAHGSQTVINPQMTIFTAQAMTGFAIGIIRNQVKSAIFDFIDGGAN